MNRKTLSFSKLLMAGRHASSWALPLRVPVHPALSLTRVQEVGQGQGGVGVYHSSQGGDFGAAPSLVVWAAFEDALNARFVSLLRVGCCQAGSTLPLWQGTSTFLPFCGSYWAWNRAWGLSSPSQEWVWTPYEAALSPGSLPRTEAGVREAP